MVKINLESCGGDSPLRWLLLRLRCISAARFPSSGGMVSAAHEAISNLVGKTGGIKNDEKMIMDHLFVSPTS